MKRIPGPPSASTKTSSRPSGKPFLIPSNTNFLKTKRRRPSFCLYDSHDRINPPLQPQRNRRQVVPLLGGESPFSCPGESRQKALFCRHSSAERDRYSAHGACAQ